MNNVYMFISELKKRKIYFELGSYRDNSIMVKVAVPGEMWECEFFEDGTVEIEIYKSDGNIFGDEMIRILYEKHSDFDPGNH